MYIQCTKKMLDKMDLTKVKFLPAAVQDDGANGFYSWHVNYITLNRRKAIVCMNNLTRYVIVLYRPKGKDIAQLGERIAEGIRAAFQAEGIPESITQEYLQNCGEAVYSKTAGRSLAANLSKACETVGYYLELLDDAAVIQNKISLALGERFTKIGDEYRYPSEELFRNLCAMKGMPQESWEQMLQIENYQLKIRLLLNGHNIWRRILIPSRCLFSQLHRVIQEVFGWFDYHLHEFIVPDAGYGRPKGNISLYALPIKIRIIDGSDPEADEYLRIVSDPRSPEYESMVEWSEMTRAPERTLEEINRRLRYYH